VTQPLHISKNIKTLETQEFLTSQGKRTPTHTLETQEAAKNPGDN